MDEKARGLEAAPFGVVGLETAFGILYTELVLSGHIPLPLLIERLTTGPARAFGLEAGTLRPGAAGDVVVFDLKAEWTVDPATFRSLGRNTPWAGRLLYGRAVVTIVAGRVVFDLTSDVARHPGGRE